jgi:hypothetical protein
MQMDTGGITVGAITALIVDSIGKTCPGLCAHEEPEGLVFHIIDRVAGGQVDVKDPSQPLSLEQLHFLCNSCNQAKGDMPWAEFVYRRRAALRAWEGARVNPAYRASEQPALGLWATP